MVDALAQEESSPWDASRIRDALIIEAGVDPATAEGIALEVEEGSEVRAKPCHDNDHP